MEPQLASSPLPLNLPFRLPVVLAVLAVATVTDLCTRRVPAWLTFGGIAAGLLAAGVTGGWAGLAGSVLGATVGGGVLLAFVLRGGFGAADALLLAFVGAWAGWVGALQTVWWAALVGAAFALVALSRRRRSFPYVPALAAGAALALFTGWPAA